jgi:hypothetical protein
LIGASAAFKPADQSNMNVVIAQNLATQANPTKPARSQTGLFRFRHPLWLPRNKLDAAGSAAGISAAGMQLIRCSILCKCQHQTLARLDFKLSVTLYRDFWHINRSYNSH